MVQQYMMPALASSSAYIMPKNMENSMKSVKAIEKLMQSIFMISPGVFLSVSMILLFMIDPS